MRKEIKKAPTIRFRGFTDDWEQRKLGDICGVYDGVHQTPDYQEDGVMFLSVENIATLTSEKYISEDAYNRNYKAYPEKGDILMTRIGDVGTPHVVETNEKLAYYVSLALLKPKGIDSYFLNNAIQTSPFQKGLLERTLLTAIPMKINKDEIGKVDISFPVNISEQKQIGSYFRNLDNLITLHQRKLDQLKKLKKYFLQNMFPAKGEKVPRIRFKGFTGDWEQRKLGDCFWSLPNNTLSRAELSYENGVVMNIHYGDVLIKFDECLDVSKERLPFIEKQSVAEKIKTSYLKNGDVIVADTAEDETVGKCTEIIGLTDQKVISGLHTIPLRPNEQFATGYLGFYLNSAAYHRQLKPLMQGIKVTSISKSAIQDTVIKYPLDIREQALIGQHFMNLGHLITLHQRKLNQLQTMKKFMLQNLFI